VCECTNIGAEITPPLLNDVKTGKMPINVGFGFN
jgi:hypothetical protein